MLPPPFCRHAMKRPVLPPTLLSLSLVVGCGARSETWDDPAPGVAGPCRWSLGARATVEDGPLPDPQLALGETPAGTFVVWSTSARQGGPWRTDWRLRLLGAAGGAAHELARIAQPAAPFAYTTDPMFVAWGATNGAFLSSLPGHGCFFVPLAATGAPAGPAVTTPNARCAFLRARADGYRFVRCEAPAALPVRCEAVDVDVVGNPVRRVALPSTSAYLAAAALPGGETLLVWADVAGDQHRLRAVRLDAGGHAAAAPSELASLTGPVGTLQGLRALPLGDGAVVAWSEVRDLRRAGTRYAIRTDADGRPAAAPRVVATTDDPARVTLFAAGNSLLRVTVDDSPAAPSIRVQPLTPDGDVAGAPLEIERGRFVTDARVVATTAGAALVYAAHPDATNGAISTQNVIAAASLRCTP